MTIHDLTAGGAISKSLGARTRRPLQPRANAGEAGSTAARFIRSLLARVWAAIHRANERARRRLAQQHLHGLPDYLLRDIGIDRSEIAFIRSFGRSAVRRGDGPGR